MLAEESTESLERLPSRALVRLREPSLRYVLAHGGSERVLVDSAWACEFDPSLLSRGDHFWVASWAAERLVLDDEALGFEQPCVRYGTDPMDELHITDPILRFESRAAFALLGSQAEKAAVKAARGGRRG